MEKTYLKKIENKPTFFLIIIGLIGIVIRLYYLPFDLPIISDSVNYFSYAVVVSQQGQLPEGWLLHNNGWPVFLSFFFSIFDLEDFLFLTHLQRYLTIVISVLTIIPVYLLCNRFIEKPYAILGAAIFAFDPRIIINSLLGLTESLYVLLGALTLFLFLSKNIKVVFASFIVLSLFAMIRFEGILLVLPFWIIFFVRFRKDKKIVMKYLFVIGITVLVLFPMAFFRIEATGNDGLISPLIGGSKWVSNAIIQEKIMTDDPIYGTESTQNRLLQFIGLAIINLTKFLGWVMIPTFIFFIPIGIYFFLKNRNASTVIVIIFTVSLLVPSFYGYGRGIEETRYLYVIFPILCLISSFTIKKICTKFKKQNLVMILLMVGIITSSLIFLDYKKIDYEYERESYLIAKDIVKIANGINYYSPDSKYIQIAEIANNWPVIPLPKETSYNQSFEMKKISPNNFSTLVEYIKNSEEKGLTHLVITGKENKSEFLNDVFYNEEKYPYLTKEYDSLERGFNYHVKIYKIDYEKFSSFSGEI